MSDATPTWARGRLRYKKYGLGEPWSDWLVFQSFSHFAFDIHLLTPYAKIVIPTPDLVKYEIEPF